MKIRIRLWVKITSLIIILFTMLFIYGRFINTKGFKVFEYSISDNIPNSFNGFKIVHISDINYKHTTSYNDLKKIIKRINLINPDLVIFTGDLLNINIKYSEKDIKDLIKLLSSIKANIGKYAINGEEDLEFDEFEQILNNSNFTLLNNYELIYNKSSDKILLTNVDTNEYNDLYKIFIIHKPDDIDNINYDKYNLILAGHSINGYINIPYIKNLFLTEGSKKYYNNYYKLNNTLFYISNGIGTKEYKFRILNKPSFNLYRLKKD